MKILKEKSRTYKNQEYYKYKINIPSVIMDQCKFKEGDELEAISNDNTLTLRKKQKID
ncbi:MAG: hypothetical protein AABX23_00075 [Nanoarchaeota archaeon]